MKTISAVFLTGISQPLVESRMLNAVLIVLLVTAILGPILTQHYAPRMLDELPPPRGGG